MMDDILRAIVNKRHYDHSRLEHRHADYRDDRYSHYNPLFELLRRLLRSKAVLGGIAVLVLLIAALGIWLLSVLLPYVGQALFLLDERGIKGVLEMIEPLLLRIWEGAGK